MAAYSTYKSLEKPLSTEKYNVGVANKNIDIIDSELHKLDLKNENQDNLLATKESLNSEISRAKNAENTIADNLSGLISDLTARLNTLADSDDTTLDQLSEIVAYTKNNKTLIDSITTSKINISDIIDTLTSTVTNKPLSANQGKVLNDIKVNKVSGKGLSTNDYTTAEKNKLSGIASGAEVNVQPNWDETDETSSSFIKNKPASMPASDVFEWAKANEKPTYTKSEIGLGNVENKSSGDIRNELTKENVINALGYTPPATITTYTASTTVPKANGTASAGSETAYARGDHVHPLQTNVSGNAGTADYLNPHHIAENANLNNLTTSGFYYCPANKTVATCSNCPTENAFFMIVGKHAGVYQEIIEYVISNPQRYMRNNYNNIWGNWYRVYTTADIPSSNGGITYNDSEPASLSVEMTWIGN